MRYPRNRGHVQYEVGGLLSDFHRFMVKMSDCTGDLLEELEEVRVSVIWQIPNFFSLYTEKDNCFQSSVFFSGNAAWKLAIYPNGIPNTWPGVGYVMVYVCRVDSGAPKHVTIKVTLDNADQKKTNTLARSSILCEAEGGRMFSCSIKKSYLQQKKDIIAPLDVLTIRCTLVERCFEDSLLRRLWNLSLHFKRVFSSRENTDLTLKLKDGMVRAHRLVLSSRSPVFESIFSLDTRERKTREVEIEDIDEGAFNIILSYIYSGDPLGLSPRNALDVYKASHKYELHDLTQCCRECIMISLTVDSICDVIATANLYEDERLMEGAISFFERYREWIIETKEWKTLKENNSKLACEILESLLGKGN